MPTFLFLLVAPMICGSTHESGKVKFSQSCGFQSYCQGGGEIQCKSEINPEGRIVILLECLSENTTVEFLDLVTDGEYYHVKAAYTAKQDPLSLDDEFFTKKISFIIEPKNVHEFTLQGSTVFTTDFVEVKLIKEKTSSDLIE